ncbi:CHAT domain-containing protein [Lentzea albidocapillata subsp. violacea]|uniref:CHAT domain-containing protein n=1 Tax=Lentzea albidocapillata subsp. violacea TaxID=128104 RepID=A0A1G8U534_9PSEU|nr:CHAT domain-containing protein [Lentzea albidocapillata]SDJ48878.1 CHAT domain-containing protein [Lentzea albidocapillata subsp. violacea]
MIWRDGGDYERACEHFQAFERTGQRSQLEAAIDGFRALASSRMDGAVANGLAIALWSRYEVLGGRGDLDEAVALLRDAVAWHPGDTERLPSYLANLAGTLRLRWRVTGSRADLMEAVAASRHAVEVTGARHRRCSARLNNQADGLLALHLHFGDSSALDSAIVLFRQAVEAADAGSDDLVNAKSNLAEALRLRFQSTRDIGLLDEAAVLAGAVVPRARTRSLRARFQSNLALVLLARHSATGRQKDLRAATDLVRQALKESPAGHPNRAERSAVLAECRRLALVSSHGSGRAPHRLAPGTGRPPFRLRRTARRLVRATEDAVRSTPHGHPTRADAMLKHGLALAIRGDGAAALALYRQVAGEGDFPPRMRVEAARLWAYEMTRIQDWQAALEAFRLAVELLPRTAPRHVTQADRERALAAFAGLASDAAACAIQAGDPRLAVALLEQGRGVMLGHALDARTEITDLEEQHPDLARRFDELRTVLDSSFHDGAGLSGERRHALTEEWNHLVDSIRSLPGFARFLRPPAVEELVNAVGRGPVVIVNVSALRCDALVIAEGDVVPVALPEVRLDDLADRAERFRRDPADEIDSTLSWLGRAVADRLTLPTGPGQTRLWWIPTGPMSALPLHAAGDVMDRFVSSYAPTLRSLVSVWKASAITRPDDPLVVAVPSAPGVPDLPAAQDEADDIATRFPRPHVLTAHRALRRPVLEALSRHRWAHFACHAMSAGGEGRLVLWDHIEEPLSVNDIARLRLAGAEIAFLSACETSAAPPELTDESLHITGAFHMAGFRHVIGTLWPVGDRTAQLVASHYYDALAVTPSPAIALHTAVQQVRGTRATAQWAPFVHVGG